MRPFERIAKQAKVVYGDQTAIPLCVHLFFWWIEEQKQKGKRRRIVVARSNQIMAAVKSVITKPSNPR
jgi:hypothetical protein